MSLIYEALRKSEEERRLGEAPTLLGAPPASWRHAREELERRRRQLWLVVPAILAVAIGAGWWVGSRAPSATPPDAPVQGTERVYGEGARALPPAPAAAAPVATTSQPLDPTAATPPAESATASPALPRTYDDVAAKEGVDPETLRKFEQGEVFAPNADALKPVQPTAETPVVPPEAALPQPLPDPEPAEPGVASVPPPPMPPPAVAAPAAPIASAPAPAVPEAAPVVAPAVVEAAPADPAGVPNVYDLPYDVRKSLPPLVLSMHVFAQDPTRRFVLLDDQRLVEGEKAGAVTLREIRSDGVILEHEGRAFFVPRSGQ